MNLQEQVKVRIVTALQKEMPTKAAEIAKKFGNYTERNFREMIGDMTGGVVTKRIWEYERDSLKITYSERMGSKVVVYWNSQLVFASHDARLIPVQIYSFIPGEWEAKLEELYTPIAARKLESVRMDEERLRKSFAL